MDPETLATLRGSITKWRAIVDGTGVDKGVKNCPLCARFFGLENPDEPEDDTMCFGCPVREDSGEDNCGGTPYQEWVQHHRAHHGWSINMPLDLKPWPGCEGCVVVAQAELDYLIGLLPEGEKA